VNTLFFSVAVFSFFEVLCVSSKVLLAMKKNPGPTLENKLFPWRGQLWLVIIALLISTIGSAQQQITSISTSGSNPAMVTYNGIKGAGLRNSTGGLRSAWDSTGTSFTVNYNAAATNNIKSVTQYTVSGLSTTVLTAPANAIVKLRRHGNAYVTDTRIHHNFWATHSSVPAALATTGTFNFTAPEVILPEDAFLLNNITSGYDNIFENSINNLHASNIERLDFIIPDGLRALSDTDLVHSGVAIFDRGSGDPFKIAAITAVNASNDPTAYGPLVAVTAANFGPGLLPSSFDYSIITRDTKYRGESRPSSPDNQNLRGVYISLQNLGLAKHQEFFGYSVFGYDVTTANPDWTTYPVTNTASGLDPVNIMGLYKTPYSVLAVPMGFHASKANATAKLDFSIYNKVSNDYVIVERSVDGTRYEALERINITRPGHFQYIDLSPAEGNNFYRLKLVEKSGVSGYSEIRRLSFSNKPVIKVFPNPATDRVTVQFPMQWQHKSISIELVDDIGRLLLHRTVQRVGTTESIAVEKLARGYYTLRIVDRQQQYIYHQRILLIEE
jgi:hypothetical protein